MTYQTTRTTLHQSQYNIWYNYNADCANVLNCRLYSPLWRDTRVVVAVRSTSWAGCSHTQCFCRYAL